VTIPISSNTPSEGTASPASLVFTSANWDTPQTVTITGVDDTVSDGARAYVILTGAATSADPRYAGLDAADVPVTNLDNDPGVEISGGGSLVTTEWGGAATFQVKLNHQPTAAVHVPFASTNTAEGTVSPAELVFTSADWATPKTVTVTGVDDAVADGTQTYSIAIGPVTSADAAYAGIDPPDLVAHNRDDDFMAATPRLLSADHVCAMSNRQQIAVDELGTIYIAVACDSGILVFASSDGGSTFTGPTTLPNTDGNADVRISGGRGGVAYIFYGNQTIGAQFTVTRDGGATWAPVKQLQPSPTDGSSLGNVRIGAAGDTVIALLANKGGGPTSFLWRSSNAGRTFSPRATIDAFDADVSVRPNGKTVWLTTDGNLRRSTDAGATFTVIGPAGVDTALFDLDDTSFYAATSNQLNVVDLGFGGSDGGSASPQSFFVNMPAMMDVRVDSTGSALMLGDIDTGALRVARRARGAATVTDPKSLGPHADNAGLVILSPKMVGAAFSSGYLILFASTAPP
jgi:hypothetical protein